MVLDDEIIGLRSRLDRLQRSLRFVDEPVATALIKGVIADIEARIAAVESDRQQQAPHLRGGLTGVGGRGDRHGRR